MSNDFLKFPLALVVIVAIATAGLAKVYLKTKGDIERQAAKKIQDALVKVIPEAKSFEVSKAQPPLDSFWTGRDEDGQVAGLAFVGMGKGYSSDIQCMVGLDTAGTIRKISVLFQQETPGLGTRMEEVPSTKTVWQPWKESSGPETAWFQDQFSGLDGSRPIAVDRGAEWHKMDEASKAALREKNAVSALTGATISTYACVGSVSGKTKALLSAYRAAQAASLPPADSLEQSETGGTK